MGDFGLRVEGSSSFCFFFICFWEAVAAERGGPTDDQAIHLGTITIKMEIEEEKEG